jgi:hypothetical protein
MQQLRLSASDLKPFDPNPKTAFAPDFSNSSAIDGTEPELPACPVRQPERNAV